MIAICDCRKATIKRLAIVVHQWTGQQLTKPGVGELVCAPYKWAEARGKETRSILKEGQSAGMPLCIRVRKRVSGRLDKRESVDLQEGAVDQQASGGRNWMSSFEA